MADWSGEEVELIVADYFDMLSLELLGASPNSTNHDTRSSRQIAAGHKKRV